VAPQSGVGEADSSAERSATGADNRSPDPKPRKQSWRERRRDPSRFEASMPPRGGFWKGALLGFVLGLPATAGAVYLAARFGIGDRAASFETTLRFAVVFAGVPAILSAAGVGRAAARAAVAKTRGGLMRSARTGALGFAAACVGLTLLVAVPIGGLPPSPVRWLWLAPPGAVAGAVVGVLIGLWAGSRGTADVQAPEPPPPE
jgi:hypothetical protein